MVGPGPLSGIRVLDLTRVVAGPYAGQILGDLGAEVVKIERCGQGDDSRHVGPPWMKDGEGSDSEESTYFQAVNRNKYSITVDYSVPQGAALLRELAAKSDVLLENYRSGTLDKYGLGYADLKKTNGRLVYCSITGFGQTGPYSSRSGYDYLVQAMSGLMSVTGRRDGEPGAGPLRVGVPISDICAGLYAAIAVLAALNHRHSSGEGQHIDLALFDAQIAAMLNAFSAWFNGGVALGRTGNDHPSSVPNGVFSVDDGHILIATFNDREFLRLCEVLRHAEWAEDPRFSNMGGRVANRELLNKLITEALRGKAKAEWVEVLNRNLIPCGSINEMADLEQDPQVVARGLVVTQAHPLHGQVRSAASPLRFSASPVSYRLPPPATGQHTEEILAAWLGLDAGQIAALRARKAI